MVPFSGDKRKNIGGVLQWEGEDWNQFQALILGAQTVGSASLKLKKEI